MPRSLLALTLLVFALSSTHSVYADLVFYTNRVEWESNSENLVFEDFEEANLPAGAASMPNPLDANTNNDIFSAGDIIDNLRLEAPDDLIEDEIAVINLDLFGGSGKAVLANVIDDETNTGASFSAFFLDNQTSSVGMELVGFLETRTRTVSVYDTNDNLLGSQSFEFGLEGVFVGVTTDDTIGRVTLESVQDDVSGFDEIGFGQSASVPEPGAFLATALLGLGALGRRCIRRRK